MNDTLLDIARDNFKVAKLILQNSSDDSTINLAAYHCQQCIELILKHYISIGGDRYKKTHDIRDLCDQLVATGTELPFDISVIYNVSEVLTKMESRTRYVMGYLVDLKALKECVKVCDYCLDGGGRQELNDVLDVVNKVNNEIPLSFVQSVYDEMPGATVSKIATEVIVRWEMQRR